MDISFNKSTMTPDEAKKQRIYYLAEENINKSSKNLLFEKLRKNEGVLIRLKGKLESWSGPSLVALTENINISNTLALIDSNNNNKVVNKEKEGENYNNKEEIGRINKVNNENEGNKLSEFNSRKSNDINNETTKEKTINSIKLAEMAKIYVQNLNKIDENPMEIQENSQMKPKTQYEDPLNKNQKSLIIHNNNNDPIKNKDDEDFTQENLKQKGLVINNNESYFNRKYNKILPFYEKTFDLKKNQENLNEKTLDMKKKEALPEKTEYVEDYYSTEKTMNYLVTPEKPSAKPCLSYREELKTVRRPSKSNWDSDFKKKTCEKKTIEEHNIKTMRTKSQLEMSKNLENTIKNSQKEKKFETKNSKGVKIKKQKTVIIDTKEEKKNLKKSEWEWPEDRKEKICKALKDIDKKFNFLKAKVKRESFY